MADEIKPFAKKHVEAVRTDLGKAIARIAYEIEINERAEDEFSKLDRTRNLQLEIAREDQRLWSLLRDYLDTLPTNDGI